jgi:hypothetical protein
VAQRLSDEDRKSIVDELYERVESDLSHTIAAEAADILQSRVYSATRIGAVAIGKVVRWIWQILIAIGVALAAWHHDKIQISLFG